MLLYGVMEEYLIWCDLMEHGKMCGVMEHFIMGMV